MHNQRRRILGSLALFGFLVLMAGEALAVVGRPLTPVSYAGVARRTVRRNAYGYP
jgi:hypothetical protein